MICYLFKPRRKIDGKTIVSRLYSGRYRLDGERAMTTVALNVSDKQAANAKLNEIIENRQKENCGLLPSAEVRNAAERPLEEHLADFLVDREKIGRAPDYVRQLRGKIQLLIEKCGWKTVKNVTADSFLSWRGKSALGAKTLNEYHNAAYALLNWMKRQRRGLVENPLEGIEKTSLVGQETFSRRALDVREIAALLKVSGNRRPVYTVAIYTGLRRAELEQLEWQNIDLEAQTPHLRVRASTTKNRKSATLGLHPTAAAELKKFRALLGCVTPEQKVFESVFPSPDDFRDDLAAAGIRHTRERRVDFHSLRHTFATMLSVSGVTPRVAMDLMRHSDMRLTMKTYTDPNLLPTYAAVSSLPDLLGTPESVPGYNTQSNTQIRTQDLGGKGLPLSQTVADSERGTHPQTRMDKASGLNLSHSVAEGRENGDGARCRVRTCDFLRVKQALYH